MRRSTARIRATTLALAGVLILALAVRIAVYVEAPRPIDGAGLTAEQGEMARNIVDHGSWFTLNDKAFALLKDRQAEENRLVDISRVDFTTVDREARRHPVVDQMPGVAVILAGFWWVTGSQTYAGIQWLQLVLDTLIAALIYWICVRLTRRRPIAVFAALLYAVWPGAIIVAKRPMLDTWAGFFVVASVAAVLWAWERPSSRRRLAVVGLITGASIYFRPFIVLVPIAVALVLTAGVEWKKRVAFVVVPTAIALLVLAPWTIRNYYEFHRFIPTRTGLGQAVFEGNGQASKDEHAADYVRQHNRGASYGSPSYDDVLLNGAADSIASDPWAYLRRVLHRARLLLPCLLAVFLWRKWRAAVLVPVVAAAATIVPYLFIGDDSRFYLPAAFAYLILIAMTADAMFNAFYGRRTRRRAVQARFQAPARDLPLDHRNADRSPSL